MNCDFLPGGNLPIPGGAGAPVGTEVVLFRVRATRSPRRLRRPSVEARAVMSDRGGWVLFDVDGVLAASRDLVVVDRAAGERFGDRCTGRQPSEDQYQRDRERARARTGWEAE